MANTPPNLMAIVNRCLKTAITEFLSLTFSAFKLAWPFKYARISFVTSSLSPSALTIFSTLREGGVRRKES